MLREAMVRVGYQSYLYKLSFFAQVLNTTLVLFELPSFFPPPI